MMRVRAKAFRVLAALALLSITVTVERAATRASVAARSSLHRAHSLNQNASARVQSKPQTDSRRATATLPAPARFRESEGRGLLVRTWVNGRGPYEFAIDTGAGANILSRRVASEARVEFDAGGRDIQVGGMSGARTASAKRAYVRTFAIGSGENLLPSQGFTVIAEGLPLEVDGVLDPTEVFAPLGYVIDMPNATVSAFDARLMPVRASDSPPGGAVVRWLTESGSRRPFVMLSGGRRALIDTGSGFGLAVGGEAARALGIVAGEGRERDGTRDLAGGRVSSVRVRSTTVYIGQLALRNVPTDYLPRVAAGAPILLGRDALRPFRISFDPISRLISFDPS